MSVFGTDDPDYWPRLAARYDVTDIEPPPPRYKQVVLAMKADKGTYVLSAANKDIKIPDGYEAKKCGYAIQMHEDDSDGSGGIVSPRAFSSSQM